MGLKHFLIYNVERSESYLRASKTSALIFVVVVVCVLLFVNLGDL